MLYSVIEWDYVTDTTANNTPPTGAVQITGSVVQGQTLSAVTAALADADGLGSFSYQWLRAGSAVNGPTQGSYALVQADVGQTMTVRVSYTDGLGNAEVVLSGATAAVANVNDAPTGSVTIAGQATQGQVLLANTTALADLDGLGTFSYQWLRGGAPIAGANQNTYVLGASDLGLVVNVRVSYTDGFGHAEQVSSNANTPVADGLAPTALSFSPADEAVGVAVDANIALTFNEAIARGTGTILLKTATGDIVESYSAVSSLNLSINGAVLTLNPTVSLLAETGYRVEFPSGAVVDLAGNSFAGTSSYNFTTIAAGHTLSGTALSDTLLGTAGSDTINAGAGNDTVTGAGGDDTVDGGDGTDMAQFSGPRSAYMITRPFGVLTAVADGVGSDGSDSLSNVERLKFADIGVALDLGTAQPGGQAALLVGAVLGVGALTAKKPLVGAVIDLIDQGFSFQVLSGAVMRLDVWGVLANGGAASASNTQIANYLLTTVNGHAPDATTLAAAVTALDTEVGDAQGNFLWHLAESAANQTQINLVGLAETGLEFGGA